MYIPCGAREAFLRIRTARVPAKKQERKKKNRARDRVAAGGSSAGDCICYYDGSYSNSLKL